MNSFCLFVSRPLTLQGLRHLLGPFHLVLPSSPLRSIPLSRRSARCPASAVNSICSCESHGTARGDGKEQTNHFPHRPLLAGLRRGGLPRGLPGTPHSRRRPGRRRKSVQGKSSAGVCGSAAAPCSLLTWNPPPPERTESVHFNGLYRASATHG